MSPRPTFRLIYAGRSQWPSGVERFTPWHTTRIVQELEVWCVWRGRGVICREGKKSDPLGPGTVYFLHPGVGYAVQQDPRDPLGINFFGVCVRKACGEALSGYLASMPGRVEGVDAHLVESLSRRMVEKLWESYVSVVFRGGDLSAADVPRPKFTDEDEMTRTSPFCPLRIRIAAPRRWRKTSCLLSLDALVQAFLLEVRAQEQLNRRLPISGLEKRHRTMVSAIALRMQDSPGKVVRLSHLAREVGYSPDHFMRVFKKIMGCSPQDFLVGARIQRARLLLRETAFSVKEIAERLGYGNAGFFSRQFKLRVGCTPITYRGRSS